MALLVFASFLVIAACWWPNVWVSGDSLFLLAIVAVALYFRKSSSRRAERIAAACVFVVWAAAYLFLTARYVSFEAVLPNWSVSDQWPSVFGWLLNGALIGFLAATSLVAMGALIRQIARSGTRAEDQGPESLEQPASH